MTNSMIMRMAVGTENNTAIRRELERFLAVRRETVRMAEGLTPEQASFSPAPGVWSVARNLDHLAITESLYRGQMAKMLEMARAGGRTNLDVSLGEVDLNLPFVPKALMPMMAAPLTMMNYFVPAAVRETVLRYPLMKAKNPKVSEPAIDRPLNELTEQLRAGANETEQLLRDLPERAWKMTVSHPVFGRNTIANVLSLMTAHEERHGAQMRRLYREPGFPERVVNQ